MLGVLIEEWYAKVFVYLVYSCLLRRRLLLYLDVLGTLARLSENDRPFGVQAEVLRMIIKLVIASFKLHACIIVERGMQIDSA